MRVMIKEPNTPAREAEISNDLRTLQEAVGGYIEHVDFIDGIGLIVNEEGKFLGQLPNFMLRGDLIVGTAVFVKHGEEDFTSLTDEDVRLIRRHFN